MTAAEFYDQKIPVPSEMTTRDWAGVRREVRERSFFMAAVAKAEVLQVYQDTTRRVISGELSEQEARRALREGLAAVGYLPRPGEEGSIKDLSTVRRQNVTLRTNRAMAYNKSAYDKQLRALKAYPAKRMVRLQNKMVPRDWPARWREQAGQPGVNASEMAALVLSPVWVTLSRFGNPYPPYDFGSGMGDEPVGKAQAEEWGLLTPGSGSNAEAVSPSLNATLQAEPRVQSEAIKRALEQDLKGLAKFDSDGATLLFTDPNGTRPVASADLAGVIATANGADLPLLQADALRSWAAEGPGKMSPGSDLLYHFRRLVRRVIPLSGNQPLELVRAVADAAELQELLAQLKPGARWVPRADPFPFSAFALEREPGALARGLRLQVTRHQSARDLTPAVSTLADQDVHGHHVIFERGTAFRVQRQEEQDDGTVIVTLTEEVP